MEAGKRNISDIFNGNRILEIPFFQRAYVWGEPQWQRMLDDLEEVTMTGRPYFLGSVILKQKDTPTANNIGDLRTVVDGQQRLTTLNILIKVLCLKSAQNPSFDRVFRLMNGDIALMHNHNDLEAFNQVLNLTELTLVEGSSSIVQAYEFFRRQLDEKKLNLNTILTRIMFVGIDLGKEEDEQQIFDTINSLGVRLTTAELLKNYFFGRGDIESYEKNWKATFEADDETKEYWDREVTAGRSKRDTIDLFFHAFLQIKLQDPNLKVTTEDKIVFSKVEGLFDSYKQFIENYGLDKQQLILEIRSYAEMFRDAIDPTTIERQLPATSGIERINAIIFGLETSTLIPYVLYVLHNVKDIAERNAIFDYLEAYIMRRMVFKAGTKNYNQLFAERLVTNKVLTREELAAHIDKQTDRVNFMPTDDEVMKGFQESILTNKQAAGILYMLETRLRDHSRHSTSLLGLSRYSLEHVMPKKWENHWDMPATEELKTVRNRKLLTLGNLTIITASLNTSIRDAAWPVKKEGRSGNGGLTQYASGIDTFSPYLAQLIWNEQVIDQRAQHLSTEANRAWNI